MFEPLAGTYIYVPAICKKDNYKSLDEFEFHPDLTTDYRAL